MQDSVTIIDFGSQVTQLIARRIREANVYCVILPPAKALSHIKKNHPQAIILSGGPSSVTTDNLKLSPQIFELNIPILGICYGMQLIASLLGGGVSSSQSREYGETSLEVTENCQLTKAFWNKGDKTLVWMSHGDHVSSLPQGFRTIARSRFNPHAVIADDERRIYGVQFHPEVTHTIDGKKLLHHFLHDIAQCGHDWTMEQYQEKAIQAIQDKVGTNKVLVALSGGVDSAVLSVLIHKAIGDRMTAVTIDTGLLREGDITDMKDMAKQYLKTPLIIHDASEVFLARLKGVTDGEKKRHIIGRAFIEGFVAVTKKTGTPPFLAQGTLYPDVIESISPSGAASAKIKSHHNVGGLPKDMPFQLIEPFRDLFKDEVRALGRALGMEERLLNRHPFPGPGLAVRIAGEITLERLSILRKADAIYRAMLDDHAKTADIWQALAILLPIKSVGVMGDARTEGMTLVLKAVTSEDGMTAASYPLPHEFLTACAGRILNEVEGLTRVLYDVTSKPPATIEWE